LPSPFEIVCRFHWTISTHSKPSAHACAVGRHKERPIVPYLHLERTGSSERWNALTRFCLVATRALVLLQDIHSVMAGHYLQSGQPMAGQPDARFVFHESEQMLMDPRIHLPADHLSNSAFWYRPDTSRPVAERQEGIHLSHGGIPSIEAVKHRRTRSGCFTCRSRRVKVGDVMSPSFLALPRS
jgi:hypothetical protein